MSFIANDLGCYRQQQIALVVDYNDEHQRMECGIIIVGFHQLLTVDMAEELADKLDFYISKAEKLNMKGVESSVKKEDPLVIFQGYYGNHNFGTCLKLTSPQMQLSLSMAAKLLHDLRNCVELCLACVKGVAKQNGFRIKGELIERIIDTADPKVQRQQKSAVIRNVHRWQRLDILSM